MSEPPLQHCPSCGRLSFGHAARCDCGHEFVLMRSKPSRRKPEARVNDADELDSVLRELDRRTEPIGKAIERRRSREQVPDQPPDHKLDPATKAIVTVVGGYLLVKVLVWGCVAVAALIGIVYAPVHTVAAAAVIGLLLYWRRKK